MDADLVNGLFELAGAAAGALNVIALHRDKEVKGSSIPAALFFTMWGFWNLFYYPSLDQRSSTVGALVMTVTNVTWLAMALRYSKK